MVTDEDNLLPCQFSNKRMITVDKKNIDIVPFKGNSEGNDLIM